VWHSTHQQQFSIVVSGDTLLLSTQCCVAITAPAAAAAAAAAMLLLLLHAAVMKCMPTQCLMSTLLILSVLPRISAEEADNMDGGHLASASSHMHNLL